MMTSRLDWYLHAPMVFRILTDLEYLKKRGVEFKMEGSTIHKIGGWRYSPSEITDFMAAETVLRNEGCACTPHFAAICLLEGVSFHRVLDKGRALIKRIYKTQIERKESNDLF